jgi:hypothetical protein
LLISKHVCLILMSVILLLLLLFFTFSMSYTFCWNMDMIYWVIRTEERKFLVWHYILILLGERLSLIFALCV